MVLPEANDITDFVISGSKLRLIRPVVAFTSRQLFQTILELRQETVVNKVCLAGYETQRVQFLDQLINFALGGGIITKLLSDTIEDGSKTLPQGTVELRRTCLYSGIFNQADTPVYSFAECAYVRLTVGLRVHVSALVHICRGQQEHGDA